MVCLTLLPLSWCSGVKYASVGGERKQSVKVTSFERFTREEENGTTYEDDHIYYRSVYYPSNNPKASDLWLDLASMIGDGVVEDSLAEESQLSGLSRHYEVHDLQFPFQFYGHTINSLAVTTGGFLYTGDLLHEKVHLTQFIAPLQADFNPTISDDGRVLVLSTNERFTVQWDQVHNQNHQDDGPFTFQVSIFPSGEIHFVYKEVPLLLNEIDNGSHPVEVGLADAFYVSLRIPGGFLVRIYQYHQVSLNILTNLNNSAYILTPVPNCVSAASCDECTAISKSSNFRCGWCRELDRCSDGVDRFRQEWLMADCNKSTGITKCSTSTSSSSSSLSGSAKAGIAVGVIVVVIMSLLLLLGIAAFSYAYRRPNSKMGQLMIKYRPKARTLNKQPTATTGVEGTSEKAILDED